DIDFVANDNVRHTSWNIAEAATIHRIEHEFFRIPFLYIADGHHRSAAAARVYQARNGAGHSGGFLAVIFPHNQMQILAYHRVLKDLNGMTTARTLEKLDGIFVNKPNGSGQPTRKHEMGLYFHSRWHTLH